MVAALTDVATAPDLPVCLDATSDRPTDPNR